MFSSYEDDSYLEDLQFENDSWSDDYDYDGQVSSYTEYQDLYGGDDWDHGQYDEY